MFLAILTTMADPRRPGLTYKIEFEDETRLNEWLDTKYFLEEKRRLWVAPDLQQDPEEGLTTSVQVFRGDRLDEPRRLAARWDQVMMLLEVAEDISRDYGKPGRPEKRCLVSTTSKERRNGKNPHMW